MRKWLAMSAAMTVAYDVTLLAILVKDGNNRAGLFFFLFKRLINTVFEPLGHLLCLA